MDDVEDSGAIVGGTGSEVFESINDALVPEAVGIDGEEGATEEQLDAMLSNLHEKVVGAVRGETSTQVLRQCMELIGADPSTRYTPMDVHVATDRLFTSLQHVMLLLVSRRMFDPMAPLADEDTKRRFTQINHIAQSAHYIRNLMIGVSGVVLMGDPLENPVRSLLPDMLMPMAVQPRARGPPIVGVLNNLLNELGRLRLGRMGDDVYTQIYVDCDGQGSVPTHAWRRLKSVKDWVAESTAMIYGADTWATVMMRGGQELIVNRLSEMNDYRFPLLRPDPGVWSFPNGVYIRDKMEFVGHDVAGAELPPGTVASMYIESRFETEAILGADSFMDIPTPNIQNIIDYQKPRTYDADDWAEVSLWIYVLLGSHLYEITPKSNIQTNLFFLGVAGCGKSTIAEMLKTLFPAESVGALGATAERTFGVYPLIDKRLVVCWEARGPFTIPQDVIQSMIAGEDVSVAIKNKKARTIRWTSRILWLGNMVPPWDDASGSIARRFIPFIMEKQVKEADPGLLPRFKREEVGAFLHKINMAWNWYQQQYGHLGIWTVLPQYFHDASNRFQQQVNPLVGFFTQPREIVFEENAYMSLEDLKQIIRNYCIRNNISTARSSTTFLSDTNLQAALARENALIFNKEMPYRGSQVTQRYVIGVTVNADGLPEDSDVLPMRTRPEAAREIRIEFKGTTFEKPSRPNNRRGNRKRKHA